MAWDNTFDIKINPWNVSQTINPSLDGDNQHNTADIENIQTETDDGTIPIMDDVTS